MSFSMPSSPGMRSVSPDLAFSVWRRGLHAKGFEYLRLSERAEGHIANFERTVDGFLAGLPYERLLPALHEVNVNPLERAVVDIDF